MTDHVYNNREPGGGDDGRVRSTTTSGQERTSKDATSDELRYCRVSEDGSELPILALTRKITLKVLSNTISRVAFQIHALA